MNPKVKPHMVYHMCTTLEEYVNAAYKVEMTLEESATKMKSWGKPSHQDLSSVVSKDQLPLRILRGQTGPRPSQLRQGQLNTLDSREVWWYVTTVESQGTTIKIVSRIGRSALSVEKRDIYTTISLIKGMGHPSLYKIRLLTIIELSPILKGQPQNSPWHRTRARRQLHLLAKDKGFIRCMN